MYTIYCVLMLFQEVFSYQWLEYNDRLDCVAGIMYGSTPVSIGTFITESAVITSSNPLQKYWKTDPSNIYIYRLRFKFNKPEYKHASNIAGNQAWQNIACVAVGHNDSSHTTIHDLMVINVWFTPIRLFPHGEFYRSPFSVHLPKPEAKPKPLGDFYFAGFGFLDMEHVKDNTILDVSYLEKSALADCDEWIPREWGRFICFYDYDDLAGVASGAPLFHSGDWPSKYGYPVLIVYGIGSFSLKKENETILVFTDLRPYSGKIYGISNFDQWLYKDGSES